MIASLFVVTDTPALLAGMAFPEPELDWPALHSLGFRHVVRLHTADYDAAPLSAHDIALEDLHGGLIPREPDGERRRVWQAAQLTANYVASGAGVVVHCVGGTGRTGTVLACALRLLGCAADEAIDAVRAQRPRWPESPWQEEVVRLGPPWCPIQQ
jgi:hypothetical protein